MIVFGIVKDAIKGAVINNRLVKFFKYGGGVIWTLKRLVKL